MTRNSQDTDTNTSIDYLGENLLAVTDHVAGPPVPASIPTHVFADRERIVEPVFGKGDNTRLVIAIDYGTTFTGKIFAAGFTSALSC